MSIFEKVIASSRTNLVVGIILIIAIIGIIVLSIQAYVKSNADENTISSLQDQLASLENEAKTNEAKLILLSAQLDDAEGHIASSDYQRDADIVLLQESLAETEDNISTINNQITSLSSNVTILQSDINQDASSIASMELQLSSLTSQLSSLNNVVVALQNKLASLEITVDSLVNAAKYPQPPFTNSSVLVSSKTINQNAGTQTLLYTFSPPYNGYVYITGFSNSTTAYVRVVNNTTTAFLDYAFGSGQTFSIPIYAGYSYSIIFGNTASSGTITATLTVIYYY